MDYKIEYLDMELACKKISNWMWYVNEEKLLDRFDRDTMNRRVTLYKECEIIESRKQIVMGDIYEVFYYKSTNYHL